MSLLVLHLGSDALLSEARSRVLEEAGYEVVTASTGNAALRILRTRPVSLVLVCHSVPPEELESTVRFMKELKPRIAIVIVHVGGLVRPQRALADGFIDGLRGPEHLLSQVAAFISRGTSAVAS